MTFPPRRSVIGSSGDAEEHVAACLRALHEHAEAGPERLAGLAPALARLDPEVVGGLPSLGRLQLYLAAHGMWDELSRVLRFAESDIADRGVVRRGLLLRRRWCLDYPLLGDGGIPADLFDARNDFELRACVDDVRHRDGRLVVAGHAYITHLDSRRSRVEVWLQRGNNRIELPIRRVSRPDVTAGSRQSAVSHDASGFRAEIDLPASAALLAGGRTGRWTLRARVTARGVTRAGRTTGGRRAGERIFEADGFTVALTRDRGLVLHRTGPADLAGDADVPRGDTVTEVQWTDAHELVLAGTGDGDAHGEGDVITLVRGRERHTWPVHRECGRWTAIIGETARGLPERGGLVPGLPLRSGNWRVLTGGEPVRLDRALVADLPEPHLTGVHEISLRTDRSAELRLAVRSGLGPHERGPYATRRRREAARRRATRLVDAALFDSYGGGQYSCNPRAISEELARRRPDLELIWVTRDGQFTVPAGVRTVLYGSREHEEALHTCRFVVANRRTQPGWYVKRPGQMFVQTWHGTPLKRLGRDLAGMRYAQRVREEDLGRYVATWDVMLAPNPFSAPILRRAFGYPGEMLESGYPRNDRLLRPECRRWARERLGVPEDRRVILYAPTWRDDELRGAAEAPRANGRFDLGDVAGPLTGGLGAADMLLVRAHYLVADRVTLPDDALDVSRFPDMADLLAAADVLVTDYSSAMFDFACTGRPMAFLTPDLERYRDEVRGFYFDFEAEAPGPLARTADDLLQILIYDDFTSYKARYQEFSEKFCPWDDGHASARVVARMLS
ncbi:CDP-glycerol glycerophosphotransferase family protein [Sphaerimonospora sp. CA-214678]|uniref:CDP-glycerol glycerophosphotransferase family protein n=1 Tax=Sphaerimonospora sp. CA-214678 TaxID=3240029 RepID=UPI003D943575